VSQWRFSQNLRASDRSACICISARFALVAAKLVLRSHRVATDLVQEGRALPPGRGSTGSRRRPASGKFQAPTIGRPWPGAEWWLWNDRRRKADLSRSRGGRRGFYVTYRKMVCAGIIRIELSRAPRPSTNQ
jgi:hypothetical protein